MSTCAVRVWSTDVTQPTCVASTHPHLAGLAARVCICRPHCACVVHRCDAMPACARWPRVRRGMCEVAPKLPLRRDGIAGPDREAVGRRKRGACASEILCPHPIHHAFDTLLTVAQCPLLQDRVLYVPYTMFHTPCCIHLLYASYTFLMRPPLQAVPSTILCACTCTGFLTRSLHLHWVSYMLLTL